MEIFYFSICYEGKDSSLFSFILCPKQEFACSTSFLENISKVLCYYLVAAFLKEQLALWNTFISEAD